MGVNFYVITYLTVDTNVNKHFPPSIFRRGIHTYFIVVYDRNGFGFRPKFRPGRNGKIISVSAETKNYFGFGYLAIFCTNSDSSGKFEGTYFLQNLFVSIRCYFLSPGGDNN